jgi:hypothetical protein
MANKLKDTTEIIAQIKEYIGQGGMVAFEHGFHYPRFKMQGYTYMCTHLSDKVMYGYKFYPLSRQKRTCNYPLSMLNYSALKKLYDSMKRYEEYCKKEA